MRAKMLLLLFLILGLSFISNVLAYETYEISDSEFEEGYNQDLSPGDKIIVNIDGQSYFVQVLSVYQDLIEISVSGLSDRERLFIADEKQYELTQENYYDINIKLNSITWTPVPNQDKGASITVKKIYEEISEGTDLPDTCLKYYTCPDGTKVKECELKDSSSGNGGGCLCQRRSSLCPQEEPEPKSCEKYFNCPDGSKVIECELKEQGCLCKSDPSSLCQQNEQKPCEKYYTCPDGTEVQYCSIEERYGSEGNIIGKGCICKQNPEGLCISPTSGGGGGSIDKSVENISTENEDVLITTNNSLWQKFIGWISKLFR